jgi:hypothetical protein
MQESIFMSSENSYWHMNWYFLRGDSLHFALKILEKQEVLQIMLCNHSVGIACCPHANVNSLDCIEMTWPESDTQSTDSIFCVRVIPWLSISSIMHVIHYPLSILLHILV